MSKFVAKEMKRLMGKAIHKHGMTEEGDHILVSVSGGKDSMSLLWLLKERLKRIPIEYRITAVHVDPGFGGYSSADSMKRFFKDAIDAIRRIVGDQSCHRQFGDYIRNFELICRKTPRYISKLNSSL